MRAVILLLAAQTLLWPWQQHVRHHHRPSSAQPASPDCVQINAVKKTLSPDRYERALRSATKEEQKIIIDCAVQP
jgi:hypothetical protein